MKDFQNTTTARGNHLLDEIQCWIANEGLAVEDAITEEAQTYQDLGAIVAQLMAGGYLEEEVVFQAAARGVTAMMDDSYDRW